MTKIVILGGGFGGIRASLDLNKKLGDRPDIRITLIDRNNYQTFHPSLYEVAAAFGITHVDPFHQVLKSTITIPYSKIFKNTNVQIIQTEISGIDLEQRKISTSGENVVDFDYLILAMGSEVSFYDIPGVREYAYKFKNMEDSLKLFEDIEKCYQDPTLSSRGAPTFLVGGAGFNGIELAAELALCTNHMAHKHNFKIPRCARIILLEATATILPMISERERHIIRRRLEQLDIEIIENAIIAEVIDGNTIRLKNGNKISGDFIIWTAGIKVPEMLKTISGLALDKTGRVIVNTCMQVNQDNLFAIGDSAIFIDPDKETPVPQMVLPAIDQARIAAENIGRLIDHRTKLRMYKPQYGAWAAPVGGKYAVVHLGTLLSFSGKLGYIIRELIDVRYFLAVLPFMEAVRLVRTRLSVFFKND